MRLDMTPETSQLRKHCSYCVNVSVLTGLFKGAEVIPPLVWEAPSVLTGLVGVETV